MTTVLIADPDVAWRDLLSKSLAEADGLHIVGASVNSKLCLDKVKTTNPDLVIAAAAFSDMDIVRLAKEIRQIAPETGIIVLVSAENSTEANLAVAALGEGAFDYFVKPGVRCADTYIPSIRRQLSAKISCFTIKKYSIRAKQSGLATKAASQGGSAAPVLTQPLKIISNFLKTQDKFRVVVIGVSTGGPEALTKMIPLFPGNFPLPIVIVLHMPKLFTGPMAADLAKKSAITVTEAADGDILAAGHAYLAPGGIHLTVDRGTRGNFVLKTNDGFPENGCKPAVDVLFRSAAAVAGEKTIGVILTGMGVDGTKGAQALMECKVPILAQDEQTSLIWGMPGSVVKAGLATEVLPLLKIPERIISMVSTHE
jgi:two-component system chemotaxis response regulator CheB